MDIKEKRASIDQLDFQIAELLSQRLKLTEEIGRLKDPSNLSLRDIDREEVVLRNVRSVSEPKYSAYVSSIYDSIIDASITLQMNSCDVKSEVTKKITYELENMSDSFCTKATVACQGIQGASTEAAVRAMIKSPDLKYYNSFDKVVKVVESGEADYGVFPLENSKYGARGAIYDLIRDHDFYIVRSTKRLINRNYTKFICISRKPEFHPDDNMVSLMFKIEHVPKALFHAIGKFSSLGINISKVDARPIPESDFNYLIYIDLEAPVKMPEMQAIIGYMDKRYEYFRFIGSYHEV
jgi:chorismate mutase